MPAPRPPSNSMRRYSGNLLAALRLAQTGLQRCEKYDATYRAKPATAYPNQFAAPADMATLNAALTLLGTLIAAKGPIPNRP